MRQACAGTIYLYPVYSEDLGEILGFSLNEMQTVGTMMNAGAWQWRRGGRGAAVVAPGL